MIYGITFILVVIIYLQVNKLLEQEEIKELRVYLIIMFIAILYSYGILLEWNLPRPGTIIQNIYKPISDYIFLQEK